MVLLLPLGKGKKMRTLEAPSECMSILPALVHFLAVFKYVSDILFGMILTGETLSACPLASSPLLQNHTSLNYAFFSMRSMPRVRSPIISLSTL